MKDTIATENSGTHGRWGWGASNLMVGDESPIEQEQDGRWHCLQDVAGDRWTVCLVLQTTAPGPFRALDRCSRM